MSDAVVPEKEIFVDVIVNLVKQYGRNAREATEELAARYNYPSNAAALAVLLAYLHLNLRVPVQRVLEGLRDEPGDLANEFDIGTLFDDPTVVGVILAWAGSARDPEQPPITNVGTALLYFAVSYGSFKTLDVLLADSRVSRQLSLADYRDITRALSAPLSKLAEDRSNKNRSVVQLDAVVDTLREGGMNAVRAAVRTLEQEENALLESAAQLERDKEDAILDDELKTTKNLIAYIEGQLAAHRKSGDAMRKCLRQANADTEAFLNDLSNQQALVRNQANAQFEELMKIFTDRVEKMTADPDADFNDKELLSQVPSEPVVTFEVDAIEEKKALEANIAKYESTVEMHKMPAIPETRERLDAHMAFLNYLRGHIAMVNTLTDQKRDELAAMNEKLDAQLEQHKNKQADELSVRLKFLDVNSYF